MSANFDKIQKDLLEFFEFVLETCESSKNGGCKIAALGLYNHGKSTLLNQLTGDYKCETFKVADKRETTVEKHVQSGGVEYVDTPGLNADDYDTKTALKAINASDLYLFVHNAKTGELSKPEVDFLKEVSKNLDAKEFLKACIFVLTKASQVTDKEVEGEKKRIVEQLRSKAIFGVDVPINIISVDSVSYAKGKLENKQLLAKKGNIDALKEMINLVVEEVDIEAKKQAEICAMADVLMADMAVCERELDAEKATLQDEYDSIKSEFDEAVARYHEIREEIRDLERRIERKQEKLYNL